MNVSIKTIEAPQTEQVTIECLEVTKEIEEEYHKNKFIRCSKSIVLNLLKIDSLKPALNGRFEAHMENGEDIIISRQYAKIIKKYVLEEL